MGNIMQRNAAPSARHRGNKILSAISGSTTFWAIVLAMVGLFTGYLGLNSFMPRGRDGQAGKPRSKLRMPQQWPLVPRPLANSRERLVWHWLRKVFPGHHIMVKLPVTRFTMPRQPGEASEWFELLSRAYCSFTLCDSKGHVIGCVDVLGPHGLSRSNRQLKQTLLAQCGIAYWVISPDALPEPSALRADFLGVNPADLEAMPASSFAELEAARHHLHQTLDRNRSQRAPGPAPDPTPAHEGDAPSGWAQADSFLGSLDSRRTPLDRH